MAKSNLLIAFLVIFIFPVFIGSYNKYSHLDYKDMNYKEIGEEYTNYFSDGMNEITIISDLGQGSIKVFDKIGQAIIWIKDTMVIIYNYIVQIPQKIFNLFIPDKTEDNRSPPMVGGDGWEQTDYGWIGQL